MIVSNMNEYIVFIFYMVGAKNNIKLFSLDIS